MKLKVLKWNHNLDAHECQIIESDDPIFASRYPGQVRKEFVDIVTCGGLTPPKDANYTEWLKSLEGKEIECAFLSPFISISQETRIVL